MVPAVRRSAVVWWTSARRDARWSTLQSVHHDTGPRRAFLLASLGTLPLFVWWLGWFPGFISPDSLDQLRQIQTGDFTNGHPAFHTITMWLITRVWDSPGAVTLVQIAALGLLLAVVARRLVELGAPRWAAVGAAWLVALSPAVGPTAISLWKDVAFTVAFLWVFAELLMLARLHSAYWWDARNPIRLGAALALVWLSRHNGLLTALLVVAVLVWINRASLSRLAPTVLTLLAIVAVVQGPVYWMFSVDRSKPAAAEVLIPVVASSFLHEPDNFSTDELRLLSSIAPLEVWQSRYDCDNADRLLFAPETNIDSIRQDSGAFLRLGIRAAVRDLDTTMGLFWCRASFLFAPGQPADAYLQRPPFEIPPNDLDVVRSPVWSPAFDVTRHIFQSTESSSWLWLTWRPAIVIWSMLATYALLARIPATRALLIPGGLLGIHLLNVSFTSLNHEFRLAFPLYVAGLLSLPLLWFARHPGGLAQPEAGHVAMGRTLLHDNVTSVRVRQRESERVK